MMRTLVYASLFALSGCATYRATPVRYDFDGARGPPLPQARLAATIAVPPVTAPRWLRTSALTYRLEYQPPANLRAYALSQWVAPPEALLTLRLRQWVEADNSGITLRRLPGSSAAYRLEVSLETFAQIFDSPTHSRCVVALRATLMATSGNVLAQKTFSATRTAPSPDAVGGAQGLVAASDADFQKILAWLAGIIPVPSGDFLSRAEHSRH